MSPCNKPPVIVILGPTAVGKTQLSIELAEKMNAEIISADSRLFYIGMDIGTAKPNLVERTRVKHHLIDVCMPDETWSLAVFQKYARATILNIQERGKLPMIVGGTGQYLQGLLEEFSVPEIPPDTRLREMLTRWGNEVSPERLHQRLGILDPEAALRIEPRNLRRTVRALEVIFHTGRKFSILRQSHPSPYSIIKIGLIRPRADLYERIDQRVENMFEAGLVNEVLGLLKQGYSPKLPALSAIGYREVIDYLWGRSTEEEAVRLIKRQTRQFVRRQANWFKQDDPTIHWLDMEDYPVEKAERMIREFLSQQGQEWNNPSVK